MQNFLENKIVLIAGGSSGIGFEIAKASLQQGAAIHLVGTNIEKLEIARKILESDKVYIHDLDISNEQSVRELSNTINKIDHLVTTAARLTFKPLAELTSEEIQSMINSKLVGPVFLAKYFSHKIDSEGSIVFFSGVAADKGSAGASIVGAVNGALHGLAKNLVYELSPVRVNVVSPGIVQSPTWSFMTEEQQSDFFRNNAKELPVLKVGSTADLTEAALFLMSNKYASGTILTVDGGANA